jgi:signal transduction histidine kinase/FixJ family two-component response regulator
MTGWSRWFGPVPVVLAFLGLGAALTVFLVYGTWVREADEIRPVQHLATRIDDAIFTNRQADLQSLAQSGEVIRVARGLDGPDNPQVSLVLATTRRIFNADIVYILDRTGEVVSCTKYEGDKTLTGNHYAFRPYFISALRGNRTVYPAMGVTTRLRGLYFSTPIHLGDRNIVGVLVVKAGLEEIDRILAESPEPAFLVSPDGVIFASNQKEMLFHYVKPMGPDELARIEATQQFGGEALRPFANLFGEHSGATFNHARWSVSRRPILGDWTLVVLSRGGPSYVINRHLVIAAAWALGAMTLIIAVLMSILRAKARAEAARLSTEEELKTYQGNLEGLVERRTAELREAKEAAESATEAKSIFLASMSHDLRTPLNAIMGYAQLLARAVTDPADRDNLQRIHRAGEHLLDLINHVLSLSKIEAGKLTLNRQPFSTERFFKSIEDLTRIRATAKGLEFRLEVRRPFPEALLGDALKLRQVLVNILGNAIQYTRQGSVGLEVARTGNLVRFTVRDTGPGMGAEERDSLFQAFHQARSGLEAGEGAGLGLHISQAMVRLMGGLIQVESEPGRGSAFSFEIPMDEGRLEAEAPAPPALGLAPGQPRLRMLVVDDVEDNRTLLARMLSAMGMEVREAQDGPAALALVESWQPAGVWMDLRMPGLDGYEALRRIRQREAELGRPRTVVIAMTASVLDVDLDPFQEAAFDDLMTKPFPEGELVDLLHRHFGLEVARAATPPALPEAELAPRIRALDPAWARSFHHTLVAGNRAEALDLLGLLPDRALADSFIPQVKAFRFDAVLRLMGMGGSHA